MPAPLRLYRTLLRLYPARFREEYAGPMERQFLDDYGDAGTRGARALLWLRALRDLAVSIPAQAAREFRQDAVHAVRFYRRRAGVTAMAVASLAVGIGAMTGAFSVVNALLLRNLPFEAPPERLALEQRLIPRFDGGVKAASVNWWRTSGYIESAATYQTCDMNFVVRGWSEWVKVTETSAEFFRTLGAGLTLGRGFAPDEDEPGKTGVAVIGYDLWRRVFSGDRAAVGAVVRINGVPLTVIGVAAPGLDFPNKASVWTPTIFEGSNLPQSGGDPSYTLARFKPGVTIAQANAAYYEALRRAFPEAAGRDEPSRRSYGIEHRWQGLRDLLAGPARQASLLLFWMTALALLIACANVAHLLLSRIAERRRDWAIRSALGASRARLTQQLVTESVLLTGSAAAAGLPVAWWACRLASTYAQAKTAAQVYTALDWRVLAFAMGLALATGLALGALIAALTGRAQPRADSMRAESGTHGAGIRRAGGGLIALQAALALALAAGSISIGRAFIKLAGTDLGFEAANAVTVSVSLTGSRYEAAHNENDYYRDALERLRAIPGVEAAGATDDVPLEPRTRWFPAFDFESGNTREMAIQVSCTPGYFRSIRAAIVAGRDFTDADRRGAQSVAILNEAFAARNGGFSLLGRRVRPFRQDEPMTIIGIVRTMHIGLDRSGAQIYTPAAQDPPSSATFVARVHGAPKNYLAAAREAIRRVDPEIPAFRVETLDKRFEDALSRPRFYTACVLFFGCFALLLAVVGVYGAAAHSVAQRTHEIGVRIAVGGAPRDVRLMLLRQSLIPVAVGMAAGVAAALGLGRFLSHLIEDAKPLGAWTCAAAALTLAATAAASVWRATRRVSRLDPMSTLRAE